MACIKTGRSLLDEASTVVNQGVRALELRYSTKSGSVLHIGTRVHLSDAKGRVVQGILRGFSPREEESEVF